MDFSGSLRGCRQPLIPSVPQRVQERKASSDLFPAVASGGPPSRSAFFTPVNGRFYSYVGAFIDPLYIYLLCRSPLCDGRHEWRQQPPAQLPRPSPSPSPLAIFDQYYKNQPTDFLRKILPPCVPEYFIAVHPDDRSLDWMFPSTPFSRGQKGTEGERRRGDTRFGFASSRALYKRSRGKGILCGRCGIFLRFAPLECALRNK